MKNRIILFTLFALTLITAVSCKKLHDTSGIPKEQLIPGKWFINRIQYKVYYNGVFAFDSIVKRDPKPENFVSFDVAAASAFQYKFNSTVTNTGTYSWKGNDSVICVTPGITYRWKKLTLTDVLFTVVNTETSPLFPGAVVEKYQTFTKPF